MTYEDLNICNASLIEYAAQNGKKYTSVAERVRAFREMIPDGKIETEIFSCDNSACIIKASVYEKIIDEIEGDKYLLLATGTSCQSKDRNYTNNSSYVEVAETNAVGRALGFMGLVGLSPDPQIATIDEINTADIKPAEPETNRPKPKQKETTANNILATSKQVNYLKSLIDDTIEQSILTMYKLPDLYALTAKQASDMIKMYVAKR